MNKNDCFADPYRGTGRTTRQLRSLIMYASSTPGSKCLYICANGSMIDYTKKQLLNLLAYEKIPVKSMGRDTVRLGNGSKVTFSLRTADGLFGFDYVDIDHFCNK